MARDQRPGVVDEQLERHAAEVMEGTLDGIEPRALALMGEGAHVDAAGVAEGQHAQLRDDAFAGDGGPGGGEVDLELASGRRLEAHGGPGFGFEALADGLHRALDGAQRDADAQLVGELLAHDLGVASVLDEPVGEPVAEVIEGFGPPAAGVGRRAAEPDVAPDGVAGDAELGGDAPQPPAPPVEFEHHEHVVRRLHLLDLRAAWCVSEVIRVRVVVHPVSPLRRGVSFRVVWGSVSGVA